MIAREILRLLFVLQFALLCRGFQVTARHTVTGTVSNALTGEPIRRALVNLSGALSASILTGADGRFEFAGVLEGQIVLAVQKPGFFDLRNQSNPWLVTNSGKNDFRLTLSPAAKIAGTITDIEGEPVENAQVQLLIEEIIAGRKHWIIRNNTNSEDDGSYRMEGLLPGRYVLFVWRQTVMQESWNAPHEVTVPVYYPDAPDLASAQAIEMQPGQGLRVDFRLRTERGYRVTGQVAGVPAGVGVNFIFENASGQSVPFGGTSLDLARGQFLAQAVPAGIWTLTAQSFAGAGQRYEARQEITVNHADASGIQLLLHPAAVIPVTVNHAAPQSDEAPPTGRALGLNISASLMSVDASNFRVTECSYEAILRRLCSPTFLPVATSSRYRPPEMSV